MLAAKNAAALRELNQRIKDRQIQKRYLCVVHGRMPQPRQTLTALLEKGCGSKSGAGIRPAHTWRPDDSDRLSGAGGKRWIIVVENRSANRTDPSDPRPYGPSWASASGRLQIRENRADRQLGYRFPGVMRLQVSFSFTGETGLLSYLEGQTFTVPQVDFVKALFPDEPGKL